MTQEFSNNKKTVDVGKAVGLDARGAVVGPMPGPLDWTELLGALTVRLPAILFQGKLPSAERGRKCPGMAFSA